LRVHPIISGTGKATDFKFGLYVQRVHPNKSPLKILEKRERGHIQGLPKFFGYPLLSRCPFGCGRIQGLPNFFGYPLFSQERGRLQFQIWPVHSEGPSEQKPIKNFREKGAWAYPGTAHFIGYPLLSQERGKLQISNLASTFKGSIRIKAHETFWRKGSVGVLDCPNFLGTPYYLRNGETGKATDFKFCMHIYGLNRNKRLLKVREK